MGDVGCVERDLGGRDGCGGRGVEDVRPVLNRGILIRM